jgi:HD-GYP domain-containing protein (c-di-GMP phosphodiesterase class II)
LTSAANAREHCPDGIPLDESRRLVALRTGVIGYPDAHAIDVAHCSLQIAAQLDVADDVRRTVAHGALLHDVGKLRIEPQILSKPGPLTPHEQLRIRQHPLEGERIVGQEVDPPVAAVVKAHHERWDGHGYPHGLAGDQIPLAARVVAVADAYLAMREDRPYRARVSETEALRELQECAGTQFDPVCVDALVAALGVESL